MPLINDVRSRSGAPDEKQAFVHNLFESQVKKKPAAIAVEDQEQQWSYQALNSRANQLAHYLSAYLSTQGAGSNGLVGVCVERSLDMVVSILAILKAGAAYVPLDPSYPRERLAYMLQQTQASIVLTQSHLTQLPQQGQITFCLDKDWAAIAHAPISDPQHPLQTESLAYVIYTSGSTGEPKGVAMPHEPLVNLIYWQINNSIVSTGKTLQFTPISFDVSFQEIFSTLAVGGTLVLIEDKIRRDSYSLLKVIERQSIERLFLPFVALQQLAEVAVSSKILPASLKEVITAGEQLRITPALAQWFSDMSSCTLCNQYGPSESHVVTAHRLAENPSDWPVLPPIGQAVDHAEIHLLDDELKPIQQGDIGEIYIGGKCLAQGYLNRPDLSAERFIKAENRGSVRLYKTGDFARCLPNGNYEYMGRSDQQVKIRGHRIELGEIEAILDRHFCVQAAAVVAQITELKPAQLIGYVVLNTADSPLNIAAELRQFVSTQLPDYMIPSQIVCLEAFPLTPSGKIDRRRLPVPEKQLYQDDNFVEPETAIEKHVARIWEKVLGVSPIGTSHHFFELGGHSLLATQIIIRIREELEQDVSFQQLLERPTLGELSHWLSTQPKIDSSLPVTLKPFSRAGSLSLSPVQEPLWFLDQLVPNHPFYTVPEAFRLTGPLNLQALQQGLQTIVDRHEALRTVFDIQAGKPVQVVKEKGLCPFEVIDFSTLFSTLADADRTAALETQLVQRARVPFDLSKDVLLRASLFKIDSTEHILLIGLHHIVCDGWSVSVLLHELAKLYAAFATHQPSPLLPLPVQYGDFTLWQRQRLTADICEQQLAYWKTKLGDSVPMLELPYDFSRPALPSYSGKRQFIKLSEPLTQAVKALARESGTTLYMTLLTAFQTLLYRYSGQADIAVGSMLASRPHPALEQLIGFFPNTVVLRTDLSGMPSFRTLLQRVKAVTLEAYAHQDLPFDQLVQALHPDHKPGQNPFFQVVFNLQNTPALSWEIPQLKIAPIELDNGTTKFDLFLELTENSAGMTGYFEYSTDLFRAETIARMSGHFIHLLNAAVANPDSSIAELSLFSEAELRQLASWNDTQAEYPKHCCLHELIEAQVRKTPSAIALEAGSCSLTYEALNQRSNQCAHYLRSLGVRPGSLVGVFVDRSAELVISLLAILKAGGTYVPLDPIYPPERLSLMAEDSGLSWILTQTSLSSQLSVASAHVLCLDELASTLSQLSSENLELLSSPLDVACIIYTSGSTGKPKGVQTQHRALVNLLWFMKQRPGLVATDIWIAVTTICFDIAGVEIYLPLMVGAKIVLASRETASDPVMLAELIAATKATVMQATPATWRMLLLTGWQGAPQLNMLCGGEPMSRDLADQLLQRGKTLWNLYGPTESTVYSTAYQVKPNRGAVPIGRPIANTQVYLLETKVFQDGSQRMAAVPVGVAGELCIGGDGLAKGYLNRSQLTQEKFVADPFSADPTARIYRTGDLARYLPDGTIECLGRIDHQVKIRGFRIELGEIETVLSQHSTVHNAVVIAREDQPGQRQLVAYIVAHEDGSGAEAQKQAQKWQTIWEQTYAQSTDSADPTFNIGGWINSYTRQPMPEVAMHEWVAHTVSRILALQPKQLLEIGCGTGLLLHRIAPYCQQYRGVDLSEHAIQIIQGHLKNTPLARVVQLSAGAADSLSVGDFSAVDTVVMNSVVQYFPDIDYLFAVIEKAAQGLAPDSHIYIGDVRSLALLSAFHTATQLFQAEETLPLSQLKARIQSKVTQESELVIDARFFTALQQRLPQITQVDIQLKRGQHHNEMTQFRYDVVLHVGALPQPQPATVFMDWQASMDIESLQAQIAAMQPQRLTINKIDNARVLPALKAMAILFSAGESEAGELEGGEPMTTVAHLREYVRFSSGGASPSQTHIASSGLNPEDLWQMGQALNYQVSVDWANDGQAKTYDVTFQKN